MYREPDVQWVIELMRRNPLALLVTNGVDSEGPYATHLPIICDPQPPSGLTDLTGMVLTGHMNRGNPQWKAMYSQMPAVLSFAGPNAYVSPTVYGFTPAAPTWNFTAVQVRGIIDKVESEDETLSVVRSTVRTLEGDFGNGWDMSASIDYFRKIVPAVGAFRLTITKAEGMFKLSQEQDEPTRDRVCQHFAGQHAGRQLETAEYMSRLTDLDRR